MVCGSVRLHSLKLKHPTRCTNQLQNLLLYRTDTAQHVSGITMPIIRRLQRQFDRLLMMGIIVPETC